jgi:2-dehydro-3-deoxyphosphogluconate aldolase / (4S)-4-hydroxy-2-oxoglutarate aldolase
LITEQLLSRRLLPVVVLDRAEDAASLAEALLEGGLPVAEVTFRTGAAAAAIEEIATKVPSVLVGAGTVTRPEQVARARDAGARFIVTPGFNPAVVSAALEAGIPIVPGVNNPSGVEQAMSFGLDLLKFFPAEPSGGVAFLKALAGPYGDVGFIPTGGIGPSNLRSYLALANVRACGGSWMVDPKLISTGRFDEVARLTAEAVALANRSPDQR